VARVRLAVRQRRVRAAHLGPPSSIAARFESGDIPERWRSRTFWPYHLLSVAHWGYLLILCPSRPSASSTRAADGGARGAAACVASRRKRGGLVSPRAVPRFHRDRRHPSSPGRGRDRSCDDDDKDPYPRHNRGTKTCSAGRDREGGREGDRWQFDSRGCSFPGLRGGLDDPQEDHPDPRESLQNMDSLLQAGRIPCFRLLSRRQLALAQQRERQDPGDLAVERPPRALVRIHVLRCAVR
jgi:hypothetical protein